MALSIVINRSLKRPGLIDGARCYRIELTDKGLYLIHLGRCTIEVPNTNIASDYLTGKIMNVIENKFEKKILETETRLQTQGLDVLAKEKKSYFIPVGGLTGWVVKKNSDGTITLKIKGEKVNINLVVHCGYEQLVELIQQKLISIS